MKTKITNARVTSNYKTITSVILLKIESINLGRRGNRPLHRKLHMMKWVYS